MADKFVFADEAGNFDFSVKQGATKYFILSTVTVADCGIGHRFQDFRRSIAWDGHHVDRVFHATEDAQAVRDLVFDFLKDEDFRVDAIVLEKRKTQLHLQSEAALYKMAWYLLFKYVAGKVASRNDRLMVAASSLGTKKQREAMRSAIHDVVIQTAPSTTYQTVFWPCHSDPCLMIADYCTWAIQRKWELSDSRSHTLIAGKIRSEFPAFATGQTFYY